jgi:hypothetical protein
MPIPGVISDITHFAYGNGSKGVFAQGAGLITALVATANDITADNAIELHDSIDPTNMPNLLMILYLYNGNIVMSRSIQDGIAYSTGLSYVITGACSIHLTTHTEAESTTSSLFRQVFHIQGTLAANHTISFTTPFAMQLRHVSLNNASANAGTLKIGIKTDDDAYLLAENFGVSGGSPVVVNTATGFDGVTAGGQFPTIPAGTVVLLTITDHASHMVDATVVLTFVAG